MQLIEELISSRIMRGFIALTTVLMLSSILLLLATTIDLYAYLAHEAVAEESSYRNAQQAAFTCGRFASSRLGADPLRFMETGTTTIQLEDASICRIASAEISTDSASIFVQGNSGQSSVRMLLTATRASSTAPFKLSTWTEY